MTKLSDDKIVAMLQAGVRQSVGYSESRLSRERELVLRYYNGELPKQLHPGNSKYISLDVWDAHESMKAQLLEVFSGNNQPVTFAPQSGTDVELARVATEWCNYVVGRQNPGFHIYRDVIDDALFGRNGVAKVWWEEKTDNVPYEMSDTSLQELEAYLQQNPTTEVDDLELHDDQLGIKRASLKIKKDLSQIRILPLPPEEFFISPRAVSLPKAELVGHRYRRSYSDLVKEGYDPKKLADLRDEDSVWMSTDPEVIERFQQTDDTMLEEVLDSGQKSARMTWVYECYAELDVDDTGKADLYQIIFAGSSILSQKQVSRRPFLAFCPLPRPHSFWGTNYDTLSFATQNARTALMRSIIDHTLITTNPRYTVLNGALANPRELMENRIGGIVNVSRPDAIMPLMQGTLNPFVFSSIEALGADKEQRTGVSALSQGLNKDAISKQNSADMVEQLVSLSQVRQKIIARNFAEGFLRDLYIEVYRLTVENVAPDKIIQIAGQYVKVDPSGWPERDDLVVNFSLGYGEGAKEAQKYMGMDKYLASDPRLATLYTLDKRFNTLRQAMEGTGVKDVETYLSDPKSVPPAQPDPKAQADIAVQMADADAKKAIAQATMMKAQLDMAKMQKQHAIEDMKMQLEHLKVTSQIQLEQDKLAHKVVVDTAELVLQKEAQAADKLQAFAEPTH